VRELITVEASRLSAVRVGLEAALRGGPALMIVGEGELVRPGVEAPPTHVSDGTALVVQTSGSTAAPKRVCLSAESLLASARATQARLGGPGQWLLAVPANYIAGVQVLVRSLESEIEPAVVTGAFSPESFVAGVRSMTGDRKYVSVVPAQLQRLVEYARNDSDARRTLTDLAALLVGGQSTPLSLREEATRLGFSIVRSYGSTETSGGCVYDGVPLEGVELALEESGELRIAGNILALEYTEQRLTNSRFVMRDGKRWYLTGDEASLDAGTLRIIGRRNRMLISGGIKVSLDELDAIAAEACHSPVASIAVSSTEWGERPVMVIEGNPSSAREDLIRAEVLERLGRVAVPDRIVWTASLPMGLTGKPDYAAIARLA
jgi:O-succinylbenzoic acid--CoA ligase